MKPTAVQIAAMKAAKCTHCGGVHDIACPRVKRLRFRADGSSLYEVEFWETWRHDRVIYVEDYTANDDTGNNDQQAVPEPAQGEEHRGG